MNVSSNKPANQKEDYDRPHPSPLLQEEREVSSARRSNPA
jgi:hypothetical protein